MTTKTIRISNELRDVINNFHNKFERQLGGNVKVSKDISTKAMAISLKEIGFPDNVDMLKIKEPIKRRKEWNFEFKI